MREDNTMKALAITAAMAAGTLTYSQEAVQWRVEDGGNGHWYQLHNFGYNCFAANRDAAAAIGGHLMTANSEAEWLFVSLYARDVELISFTIGAVGPAQSGSGWTWITGEPWEYSAWGGQSPCGWGPYPNNGANGFYLWTGACGETANADLLLWDDGSQANQCAGPAMNCLVEWSADCNGDGIVDYGQILDGTFEDANENGVPDCCEGGNDCNPADCDNNGISDADEIAAGAADCDGNGVPDDCQVDSDGDGAVDECDECPADPSKTAAGSCGCGVSETDSDSDGTPDCNDGCPVDPNKVAPGVCGCGVADTDSDSDGTPDCNDGCPVDPNKVAPGLCGCGVADVDSDSDGTPDCSDACPVDPNKVAPGLCGCGVADVDSDSDGTPDCNDGCPADPSKTAPGLCGCGVADTDSDSDGTPDCSDGCPDDWLKTEPGICGCGTPESEVEVWYPDADGDGYGSVASGGLVSCTPVEGWVLDNTDCDDGDPAINPSAAEVCDNAVDEDCSGDLADCHPELVGFVGEATIIASDLLRYGAIDVYAQFDPELVELVNVYDAVILHTAGAPFVQHDFGGGSWLPTLTDPATASIDSFVTIGGEPGAASGNTTTLDPEFGDGASETPPAGAGWYNANPGNLQGLADPSTGRVHLGRFVVQQTLMSGSLSFTGSVSFKAHPDGQARQATATVSIPYPALECPWDMDGDGLVDGGDIGLLLLQWGLESESADFDGDGTVGGEDLGVMLLHWGPCL